MSQKSCKFTTADSKLNFQKSLVATLCCDIKAPSTEY